MGKIIAVANQKGGVGKTTTCTNLCCALKNEGKSVLLCDVDPQGNATSGMGVDKNGVKPTVYDVFVGAAKVSDAVIATKYGDVLPANKELSGAAIELVGMESREFILRDALESLRDRYDYIVVDCPPSLEMLTSQRPVRGGLRADPRPVRVFRSGGSGGPDHHHSRHQAAAQPQAGDRGRPADHVRRPDQLLRPGGRGGQALLPDQGVQRADPPERAAVRGPQPRQARGGL